jgi:F420H(2)-dependent quinone reductase
MPLEGTYEPSPSRMARDQVEIYERTGGREGNTLRATGLPVVVFTMRGRRSGKLRKVPLMRVEHDGAYALVASYGGHHEHPVWYYNLKSDPDSVSVQDGETIIDGRVRELSGPEREVWWQRAAEVFPTYNTYQRKTDRLIPVFLFEPRQ